MHLDFDIASSFVMMKYPMGACHLQEKAGFHVTDVLQDALVHIKVY